MNKLLIIGSLIIGLAACGRTHGTLETVDASTDPVCIPKETYEQLQTEYRELEQQLEECENTPSNEYYCSIGSKHGKCPKKCYVK